MENDPLIARLHLAATVEFLADLDDWRRQQPDIPTRSAAVRRLVQIGLETEAAAPRLKRAGRR